MEVLNGKKFHWWSGLDVGCVLIFPAGHHHGQIQDAPALFDGEKNGDQGSTTQSAAADGKQQRPAISPQGEFVRPVRR